MNVFVLNNKSNFIVKVTRKEACEIIASLADQMLKNSSNAGRREWMAENGTDFTIAVIPSKGS